jgi:hypothetical protein
VASLAGLIQRRDGSPTTPNVICGRVVPILPRHFATNIESLAATMPPFHHFSKSFELETKKTKHGVVKNLKRATEGKKVAQKESKKRSKGRHLPMMIDDDDDDVLLLLFLLK